MSRAVTAGLLLALLPVVAQAACVAPKPVKSFLRGHANWSLVDVSDLNPSDRLAWRRVHRGQCPGIATVDLGGDGEKSYALAVTNTAKDKRMERLVLLQTEGKKFTPKTLVPAFPVGDPILVWRARPKSVREFGSRQKIAIAHDAIMFQKPGMSSKVFFLADGKIRTVLTTE